MYSKKPRLEKKKKPDLRKPSYFKLKTKSFLEVGQRGFLVTCNFRELESIRECYNLLNSYADELYGKEIIDLNENKSEESSVNSTEKETKSSDEEQDILTNLSEEIKKTKHKFINKRRFQQVSTGITNLLFIKTTLPDPMELGLKIVNEIYETKKQQTKFLLRLVPISSVCKANIADILNTVGYLADKILLKESKSYAIIFQRRYNQDIKRDSVIKEVAQLIASKNCKNKVDLKNPEISIVIEILKGLACISLLPDYFKYKKYNLLELCNDKEKDKNSTEAETDNEIKEAQDEEKDQITNEDDKTK